MICDAIAWLRRTFPCHHRSHRLRLPCWRQAIYDYQCGHHNATCFNQCGSAR